MRWELTKNVMGINESELGSFQWLHAKDITTQLCDVNPQFPCHLHELLDRGEKGCIYFLSRIESSLCNVFPLPFPLSNYFTHFKELFKLIFLKLAKNVMNFIVAFPYMCVTILCSDYFSQGCRQSLLSPLLSRQPLSFYGTYIQLPSLSPHLDLSLYSHDSLFIS